jgi:hypothetical protein
MEAPRHTLIQKKVNGIYDRLFTFITTLIYTNLKSESIGQRVMGKHPMALFVLGDDAID